MEAMVVTTKYVNLFHACTHTFHCSSRFPSANSGKWRPDSTSACMRFLGLYLACVLTVAVLVSTGIAGCVDD